jgi:flavin-dependent dehydrogenase
VCGEYISNETLPYLKSLDLFPAEFLPPAITRFRLSAVSGKSEMLPLDLGGFGISRYTFDQFIYRRAVQEGVHIMQNTEVLDVSFQKDIFSIKLDSGEMEADVVVGAYGKRSKLDKRFNRSFIHARSPYVGIKYHAYTENSADLISLHNFEGGYCGVSNIEDGKTNICYLTHRDVLRRYKSIGEMEQVVLFKNPFLRNIFGQAKFLFNKPETINEISFETKSAVENHIFMVGDAAGMITPLCGNGMAMAIHSAKLASDTISEFCAKDTLTRSVVEREYEQLWRKQFAFRLWTGRQVQRLFGSEKASNIAIHLALNFKPLAKLIIRNTHGTAF